LVQDTARRQKKKNIENLKDEQHGRHKKAGVNLDNTYEGYASPVSYKMKFLCIFWLWRIVILFFCFRNVALQL